MSECICNSCKHLKQRINEESSDIEYVCKFGFPSDKCEVCEGEQCNITECGHYMAYKEDVSVKEVYCKNCGIKLEQMYEDEVDGDIFCVNCYLDSK